MSHVISWVAVETCLTQFMPLVFFYAPRKNPFKNRQKTLETNLLSETNQNSKSKDFLRNMQIFNPLRANPTK